MMMGMEEDPEDHAAVASSIFIAVIVYAVSPARTVYLHDLTFIGISCLLRIPSMAARPSESTRGNYFEMTIGKMEFKGT